jgi:hypothetical protein
MDGEVLELRCRDGQVHEIGAPRASDAIEQACRRMAFGLTP